MSFVTVQSTNQKQWVNTEPGQNPTITDNHREGGTSHEEQTEQQHLDTYSFKKTKTNPTSVQTLNHSVLDPATATCMQDGRPTPKREEMHMI